MEESALTTSRSRWEWLLPWRWRRRILWTVVPSVCLLAAAFGGLQFYSARFWSAEVHTVTITLPLSIAVLTPLAVFLLLVGIAIAFIARWRLPAARLRRSLEEIRAGQCPIEELRLPNSAGGLSPLLPILKDLLVELRRQKAQIAQLDLEMSQRVAQRTDALERSLSHLRAQATRDALTGLYNRRMLDECLEEVVTRCHDQHAPLCLMMIDLDDFKLMNDSLGHAAGDDLLRAVAQLIRSSITEHDMAFRCGGDEFLILRPGASKPQADALARHLTDLVDALVKPLNLPRKPRICIGQSIMGDAWGEPNGQALLAEADRRLYAAKAVRKTQAKDKAKEQGRAA